jgi:hypothetical protein
MTNTITAAEIERRLAFNMAGWSVPDDDLPNAPEPPEWLELLNSGQAKRAARQTVLIELPAN